MTSPFPGMDPFIEHPQLWPDVHNRLIAELGRALGPAVRPNYYIRLEERTFLDPEGLVFVGRPDLAVQRAAQGEGAKAGRPDEAPSTALAVEVPMPDHVRETYLEVRTVAGGEVVTVLEILSPADKRSGPGRALYEDKRVRMLATRSNVVEIDLLRAGEPMTVYGPPSASDYRILVSRGDRRPRADLHAFSVREPIPTFPLPLRPGDAEPEVDLRAALDEIYDTAGYDLSVDYAADPVPPLRPADATWVGALLRDAGCR